MVLDRVAPLRAHWEVSQAAKHLLPWDKIWTQPGVRLTYAACLADPAGDAGELAGQVADHQAQPHDAVAMCAAAVASRCLPASTPAAPA